MFSIFMYNSYKMHQCSNTKTGWCWSRAVEWVDWWDGRPLRAKGSLERWGSRPPIHLTAAEEAPAVPRTASQIYASARRNTGIYWNNTAGLVGLNELLLVKQESADFYIHLYYTRYIQSKQYVIKIIIFTLIYLSRRPDGSLLGMTTLLNHF